MGEIKLYDAPTPAHCSCCYGQDERQRHIDFQAECDRGFYGPEREMVMDDLILCEADVMTAGRLVGMADEAEVQALRRELAEAREAQLTAERRAEKAENYSENLEDLFDKRPQKISIDSRKRPRGRIPA